MDFLKNRKLSQKILSVLITATLVTALSITLLSYFSSQKAFQEQTVRQLSSVRDNKRDDIREYFGLAQKLIRNFAARHTVKQALYNLSPAFSSISDSLSEELKRHAESSVLNYYTQEFLPRVEDKGTFHEAVGTYLPQNPSSLYLQNLYIASNPKPVGSKHLLDAAEDGSEYSKWHREFHPEFRLYLETFGFYDIFLVDLTGTIVYTVFKETDYTTSLQTGPYAKTNIGVAYQKAQGLSKDSVVIVDFEEYIPSYGAPASFIATPVFEGDEKLGVVIFQLPIDKINTILTNNNDWEEDGLGATGETYIAGNDFRIRNNLRLLIEDKNALLSVLENDEAYTSRTLKRVDALNTTILQVKTDPASIEEALKGRSVIKTFKDFRDQEVLAASTGFHYGGLNWAIVAKIDKHEAFAPVRNLWNIIIIVIILVLIFVLIMGYYLARSIARPMLKARDLLRDLAQGKLPEVQRIDSEDETSQINNAIEDLVETQKLMVQFSENIGQGNLSVSITPRSEFDVLGKSLLKMRDNLNMVAEEDSHRNWVTTGLAEFAQMLNNNDDLKTLSEKIIVKLVKYLQANQGWLFIIQEDENNEEYLALSACYAWDKKKFVERRVNRGEGLAGQCWEEKEAAYLLDIPTDYVRISSGLGTATPRCVVIHPLKVNENVYGVIEIASFESLKDYQKEFLQKVCENIASVISTVKINDRTKRLLETSQQNTEQLRSQEEEIRQNMEELQATQEEMRRRQSLLEKELEEARQQNQWSNDRMSE